MTRISGYRQIACPNCLVRYRTPNYASINLMSFERWSDGRRVGSLFNNSAGIRACKCGKFYRLSGAIDMGLLAETQIQTIEVDENGDEIFNIPAFLRRQADETFMETLKSDVNSFFSKIKNFFVNSSPSELATNQSEKIKRTKEISVKVPLGENEIEHIPRAIYVSDAEMYSIIQDKGIYSDDMLLAARERYRMHLNDKFREPFIQYCKDRSLPVPSYEISTEHRENTQAILNSYLQAKTIDWFEIGDLYRELGEFEKASQCFEKAKSDQYRESDLERLMRATREMISNPLPI
jgi:hypothetical protein